MLTDHAERRACRRRFHFRRVGPPERSLNRSGRQASVQSLENRANHQKDPSLTRPGTPKKEHGKALKVLPLLALPGVLVAYFGFNGGGYFAGQPGVAAALMAVALAIR